MRTYHVRILPRAQGGALAAHGTAFATTPIIEQQVMEKIARALAATLDVLAEVGARHALFGGLAAGYHGRQRATADADLLVSRHFVQHIQVAMELRGYTVRQFPFLVKIYAPGEPKSVGDLVVQESNCVLRTAFLTTTPAVILGLPVSVVQRGVFVALQFHAITTRRRRSKDRIHDVLDIQGVLEKEFGPQDEQLAVEVARMIYPGAVADLKSLINDLRCGRWPGIARRVTIHTALLKRHSIGTLRRGRFLA